MTPDQTPSELVAKLYEHRIDYGAPIPETEAFMNQIDDSEIDLRRVESQLSDFECRITYWKSLCESQSARLAVARKAIEDAPHTFTCAAKDFVGGPINSRCDCWKSAALAQLNQPTNDRA